MSEKGLRQWSQDIRLHEQHHEKSYDKGRDHTCRIASSGIEGNHEHSEHSRIREAHHARSKVHKVQSAGLLHDCRHDRKTGEHRSHQCRHLL